MSDSLIEKIRNETADMQWPDEVRERAIEIIRSHTAAPDVVRTTSPLDGNPIEFTPARSEIPYNKCPDCGSDMIEVCSGLENIARGGAASTCRHSDYCEKPIKPVSVADVSKRTNVPYADVFHVLEAAGVPSVD